MDATENQSYEKRCIGLREFYVEQLLFLSIPFSTSRALSYTHFSTEDQNVDEWDKISLSRLSHTQSHSDYSLFLNKKKKYGFSNPEHTFKRLQTFGSTLTKVSRSFLEISHKTELSRRHKKMIVYPSLDMAERISLRGTMRDLRWKH